MPSFSKKRDFRSKTKGVTAARRALSSRKSYTARSNIVSSARFKSMVAAQQDPGFVDLASATYNYSTTGSIALLNTVAQGASNSQRIGKRYRLKSLQCRGYILNNPDAIANDNAFLIVYDKKPTGSLPAITDILVSANSISFNNDANSGRFQILKRVDFIMTGNNTSTATVQSNTIMSCDFFLNLKMKPVVCKAAGTGAIGDIEEGALYLVTVGSTAAGTSAATGTMAFRVRYVE